MTCHECFEAISSALDGELDPNDQQAMEEHLEECADCRHLRTRMLALSQDLKTQTYPHQTPEQISLLAQKALAGAQATKLGRLRTWLRLPHEHWVLRFGLRAASSGGLVSLVFLSLVMRWILPAYQGAEAVPLTALPDSKGLFTWAPSPELLAFGSLLVMLIGLWTAGIPGFLMDLWGEARFSVRDVLRLAGGCALLGPVAALPLLASLEGTSYVLACCLWSGFCFLLGFLIIAFKAERSLPKLALDFVILALALGLLEGLSRWSQAWPGPQELMPLLARLVGSTDFTTLSSCLGASAGAFFLIVLGSMGLLPSYRARGGRVIAILSVLLGLACAVLADRSWGALHLNVPVQAGPIGQREAYVLGSGSESPWLLTHLSYPRLDVNVVGPSGAPQAARLRVASAFLDWNEKALLSAVKQWAQDAPGVAWGLSRFLDGLGEREQSLMVVPTEARKALVESVIQTLRFRMLERVLVSEEKGAIRGQLVGLAYVSLRLLPVSPEATVEQLRETLLAEQALAAGLASRDPLSPDFEFPHQRTATSDMNGRFQFEHVPAGEYYLAILKDEPIGLTLNPSIPGRLRVGEGQVLDLSPIRLTSGVAGTDIPLNREGWTVQGVVDFSLNSELSTAKLAPGASLTGFVESEIFSGGKARIKVLAEQSSQGRSLLSVRFLARNGRELQHWKLPITGASVYNELEIDTEGLSGYLQLSFRSTQGQLTLRNIKLEARSDG